ncbi:tRNA uracil 4-sulfurtransferase ThiI [Methanolobus halotolerans]|uniref:Probable tRNA sulfurtransferase n=1 Tax=Methanolobus halotolerans TaxID=2052935 RepID=A0A4E0PTV0_9EURY|nr:tRNA uracil 4-sulfurtransferase ThiI [Methanolobus halotolerans]TGC08039.1 tRNA 4-thiouridine(8) synthase ThiI [Methanolobus halotolerans]
MFDIIIVRYGELALKSTGVRNWYEKILMSNIEAMLRQNGVSYSGIGREWGRVFIHTSDRNAAKAAADVFGVVSASPAQTTDPTIGSAAKMCASVADGLLRNGESFAIRAKRTGNHDFSSRDLAIGCGNAVWEMLESKGMEPSVDLTDPDREIFVEMRQTHAYVFTEIVQGVGGLPIGTQGKMVSLISGGIDSPVSTWLLMKRGVEIIPVYCNNEPFNDERARQRTMECITQLRKWCPGHPFKVYEVPNGLNLRAFIDKCERGKTCVLCKRTMYRIAFEIMKTEDASGIITGSSLGQVASQTAANMYAEIYGICAPIYHPLIGLDKNEIIDIARRIGTYDISITPAGSCMAVPDHPEVKARFASLPLEEEKVDIDTMVKYSIANARISKV